ncbi:uncharacterized protein BYT42DRAFT_58399 [Radiomyces spectabilis]|uniref:uncharacterized protein n=1 Tax=Radiomyces spectabilis TaxID=64574 RepID=UPI00221E689C|nr:uncharacterized protein BYT42DRAFT_58399 [Radiomyces spectabilis]KAI8373102.1 hypothetical protein BYT42DRAFT_58399 [Radiomyces spectabilis]
MNLMTIFIQEPTSDINAVHIHKSNVSLVTKSHKDSRILLLFVHSTFNGNIYRINDLL